VTTETRTLDRGEAPNEAPRLEPGRRRWSTRRPVAVLLAFLFFFGPSLAFVLGERPQEIENRALAEFPSPADGWSFFPGFTSWATDHLPLRGRAVEGHAVVSEQVFGEAPSYGSDTPGGPVAGVPAQEEDAGEGPGTEYPRVIEGDDGWLYFGDDVAHLCRPQRTLDDTMARLDRLARAVESSGRRFVLVVAPDKSTIYPDALPETFAGQECSDRRRDAFWDTVRETPPTGYVDLRGPLEEEQRRSGAPVYRQTDTHWASGGAVVYARELGRALDPVLAATSEVVDTGTISRDGDLGPMVGRRTVDEWQGRELRREGVAPVGRDALAWPDLPLDVPVTLTNTSSGAPLYQPRTLLLGDSFTNASRADVSGLFAEVSLLHSEVAATRPQVTADAVAAADVVIYEIVERTIASGRGALIDETALGTIERTLAQQPR
jgi:alginate O-acetyltransferase complex protein AlgJ